MGPGSWGSRWRISADPELGHPTGPQCQHSDASSCHGGGRGGGGEGGGGRGGGGEEEGEGEGRGGGGGILNKPSIHGSR